MRVFLSHASEDKKVAESIAFSLRNRGHKVFLDRDDLPPGESYDQQIERAVRQSDAFIYLVSPNSLAKGRYTLTELSFARRRWPDPHGRVLPVLIAPVEKESIPSYLLAVTLLEPLGNVTAETAAAIDDLGRDTQARAVAWTYAKFGSLGGLVASFLPFQFASATGLRVFGIAPDVGIVLGVTLIACAWFLSGWRTIFNLAILGAATIMLWLVVPQIWSFTTQAMIGSQRVASFDSEIEQESVKSALSEDAINAIKSGLATAESLHGALDNTLRVATYVVLGVLFNIALLACLARFTGHELERATLTYAALTGLVAGLLFSLPLTFLGDALYQQSLYLYMSKAEKDLDTFMIWSSPGLAFAFASWFAGVAAAFGYWVSRNAR